MASTKILANVAGSATVLKALFNLELDYQLQLELIRKSICFHTFTAVLNGFASLPSPVSSLPVVSELYKAPANVHNQK